MQFKAFEPGIEVQGQSLNAIVEAFQLFPSVALNILAKHGIGKMTGKQVTIDPNGWYSQQAWLDAFKAIADAVGPTSLFDIGKHVPKHAVFPPQINEIHSALQSIDIAYHMNHRRGTAVMFDPGTGKMLEGIGHYGYQRAGDRNIVMVCENPYPCEFDRGLVTAMAARFEARATTQHAANAPCRKKDGRSCTYEVSW